MVKEIYNTICEKIRPEENVDSIDCWHYVVSDIQQNSFLVRNLEDFGLLQQNNNICDCGIGLGQALFDIYQQTLISGVLKRNKHFNFYGIEKNKYLIDFFEQNLKNFWPSIEIIEDDIRNQNYSKYNIIYMNLPLKRIEDLQTFYLKVFNEIPKGGIIIEVFNKGLGYENSLYNLLSGNNQVEIIDIYGSLVYKKI